MKYILTITLCSILDNTCMPPHTFPILFEDLYDCQTYGYTKSLDKVEEIGRDNINEYKIYSTFACKPSQTIWY